MARRKRTKSKSKNKKNWIPKDLKKGAFTKWCKSRGYSGVTSECIREGQKSKNPTVRKRATLAKTFKKMAKKRKKRSKKK